MKHKGQKKSFSEDLAFHIKNNRNVSRKELKKAFSPEYTKKVTEICETVIKDKQVREQTITFIRAVHGKKIRNTSGV